LDCLETNYSRAVKRQFCGYKIETVINLWNLKSILSTSSRILTKTAVFVFDAQARRQDAKIRSRARTISDGHREVSSNALVDRPGHRDGSASPMRRKKRAGQRGRSKIVIRRPRNSAFLIDDRRGWPHIRAESPNQPDGEQQPTRSVAVHRVFLRVGRSDDSRRARREIYINTCIKTVISLRIAARATIPSRCDSRGIESRRRASEIFSFINHDRICFQHWKKILAL